MLRPLGAQIRRLRLERDLVQERLAELAGLNYKYLGRIELAQVNPSAEKLIHLARALGVTVGELFETTTPADTARRRLSPADLKGLSTPLATLTTEVDRLVKGQSRPLPQRATRRPRR